MEISDGSELIVRKLFDYDKLCFNKCIGVPEKKFTVKEENCLKNCTTKVVNAIDFLHNINKKGGVERQANKLK